MKYFENRKKKKQEMKNSSQSSKQKVKLQMLTGTKAVHQNVKKYILFRYTRLKMPNGIVFKEKNSLK